ncbi:MAG: hypothetical protein VX453_12185 [Acidobacteriota bacterium]|nr:hypothetical protein [Acidobacteriota bacterium]
MARPLIWVVVILLPVLLVWKTSDDASPLPRVSRTEMTLQEVETLAAVYDRMTRAQLADARRLVRQWGPVNRQP